MDLLSSIRKEGSRGGVDFKWSDVTTSQHRENYLGHSLMAPVGRWQKNRDLNWYAKADSDTVLNKDGKAETAEEKIARERREEIRRIKEAEEDALARALGLPVVDRGTNGVGTGANGIDVGEVKRVIKETEVGDDEIEEVGRGRGFGDFVGKMNTEGAERAADFDFNTQKGGLVGADSTPRKPKRPAREDDRSRSRSRSRDRRHRRHTHHERSRERDSGGRHRPRERDTDSRPYERRNRSYSPHPLEHQYRSRSIERRREKRERSRSPQTRRERSRSPTRKEERRYRSRSRSSSPPRRDRRDDRERERDRERRGSGAEYRAAQSRRSRPPDPRERDRESRRGGGERWR
jgi:hypothetical protein